MAPIVRVAVVQAASVAFELEPTLDRAAELTARAASDGARLVVFPEAFIGGYPKGADFGVRVGQRSPAGRDWFRRYAGSAIEVPSAETDRLGLIARENDAYVVMGVIEREGGTLYCTVLFLGPDGTLLGKHRKLMPTAMERVIWGEGDGSTLPVLETPLGRIGAVICWENYMPLLRTAMYAKGIQLYCVPTADARETWLPTIRLIAMEGRCFVLSACQFTRRRDYPDDYDCVDSEGRPAQDPDTVLMGGRSCIIGPLGEVIAGPASDGEAILCADLDLDEILRGTLDFDPVGHYSRPDIFTLTVDERPHLGVRSIRGAGEVASAGRDGESGGVRDVASAGG